MIDLGRLTFMDCAGVRALRYAHACAISNGCSVSFIRPPEPVRRVLLVTGFDDRLPFVGARLLPRGSLTAHAPAAALDAY